MTDTPLADEWIAAVNEATGCTFTVRDPPVGFDHPGVVYIRCACDPPLTIHVPVDDPNYEHKMNIAWITEEHAEGPPA